MEYTRSESNGQLFLEQQTRAYLSIPSCLFGFKNTRTMTETAASGRTVTAGSTPRTSLTWRPGTSSGSPRAKKKVVNDFIKHVGLKWMDHVEAVACDMNSDFQEAFEELCPHIQPVFDHFHLIKNFNDKVVSAVRKDEHFEGMIAHATYQITSGKVEGINQKIKTLRRHGYGYPDDEYFFLKRFDASRTTYDRNPKSHRICD